MSSSIISPCWTWGGYLSAAGYGRICIDGQDYYAHRLLYELHRGPIPDGLQIDPLCSYRACVNPEHLEAVTLVENVRRSNAREVARAKRLARMHCKHGHLYSLENTYITPHGARDCRACKKAADERRYARIA